MTAYLSAPFCGLNVTVSRSDFSVARRSVTRFSLRGPGARNRPTISCPPAFECRVELRNTADGRDRDHVRMPPGPAAGRN